MRIRKSNLSGGRRHDLLRRRRCHISVEWETSDETFLLCPLTIISLIWLQYNYERHLQLPPSLFQIPSRLNETVSEWDVRSYYSIPATHKPSSTQPNPTITAAFRPTTVSVGTNTTYLDPNDRPRRLTSGGHQDAGPPWDASPTRRPNPTAVPNHPPSVLWYSPSPH